MSFRTHTREKNLSSLYGCLYRLEAILSVLVHPKTRIITKAPNSTLSGLKDTGKKEAIGNANWRGQKVKGEEEKKGSFNPRRGAQRSGAEIYTGYSTNRSR